MTGNLFAQPGGVDDQLVEAAAPERLDLPVQQRLAANLQQRLRAVVGQRPHALAAPGGQDHRLDRGGTVFALH